MGWPDAWERLWHALKPVREVYRQRMRTAASQDPENMTPEQWAVFRAKRNAEARKRRAAAKVSPVPVAALSAPTVDHPTTGGSGDSITEKS